MAQPALFPSRELGAWQTNNSPSLYLDAPALTEGISLARLDGITSLGRVVPISFSLPNRDLGAG